MNASLICNDLKRTGTFLTVNIFAISAVTYILLFLDCCNRYWIRVCRFPEDLRLWSDSPGTIRCAERIRPADGPGDHQWNDWFGSQISLQMYSQEHRKNRGGSIAGDVAEYRKQHRVSTYLMILFTLANTHGI